jgi:hypothetical protein
MERAWLTSARFRSGRSTSGATRLLATADGVIAVTLARPDDWTLLPAWLETSDPDLAARLEMRVRSDEDADLPTNEPLWQYLTDTLPGRTTRNLIEQGRVLGLPVAATGVHREQLCPDFSQLFLTKTLPFDKRPPRVIDLSALWAGPLCSHLLQLCGAEVIKVESLSRPDGARAGHSGFYDLLNQGKRSVALDFDSTEGYRALERLINSADIVIESSRPRALSQIGIAAEKIIQENPELIWLSLTGHGRTEPQANWTAFGDDAGVAAGLSDLMLQATDAYQFAGDAIADPLTGAHAALAAWHALSSSHGGVVELSLAGVAAWCLQEEIDNQVSESGEPTIADQCREWWRAVQADPSPSNYTGRPIHTRAADFGDDTAAVLAALPQPC